MEKAGLRLEALSHSHQRRNVRGQHRPEGVNMKTKAATVSNKNPGMRSPLVFLQAIASASVTVTGCANEGKKTTSFRS
jgi:hypothetical protein